MRKGNKIVAAALLLALTVFALWGCGSPGGSQQGEQTDGALVVTDMKGREIVLDAPASRVVALTASDCEIIYALGAGDCLVGRGEYCNYPEEALQVTEVSSGTETNLEQILALQPEVVVMNAMDQSEEQVEALEKAGIQVVINAASTIEETYRSMEIIGALVGREEEASAMIDSMKQAFAEVETHRADGEERTVYFEVSPLEWGLWAAGDNTFMNEVAEMMGLTNIFKDVDGWAAVSEEQVLQRNPDYIVTVAMYFGEGVTPVEEIMSRPGWEELTAVKNGKLLNLQNDELSRPGPRLAEGAKLLYEMVYGEE